MPPESGPSPLDAPHRFGRPPLWLRCLLLFVALWLATRIVGNVTESLTGIVEGDKPAPSMAAGRG